MPAVPGLPDAPELGADTEELMNSQALATILNSSNPFGTSTIEGNAQEGFTRSTEFSPEVQAMYEKILNPDGGQEYTQAYFDRGMNLMRPEIDRQMNAEDVQLAARGLPVGSELRSDIERQSAQGRNEAMERLAMTSIMQGEQQQGRDFNEFMALASGVGGAQGPQINTLASYEMPYQAEVLPYLQEIERQNMQYGADVQEGVNKSNNKQGLLGGAANIGAAAMMPQTAPIFLAAS